MCEKTCESASALGVIFNDQNTRHSVRLFAAFHLKQFESKTLVLLECVRPHQKKANELLGEERLISKIVLLPNSPSLESGVACQRQFVTTPNCRFEFRKRRQPFIGAHDETLPIEIR